MSVSALPKIETIASNIVLRESNEQSEPYNFCEPAKLLNY